MATFRKVGFNVPRWIFALTRPGVPIEGVICHEMMGRIADWSLGWSDAFWPDARWVLADAECAQDGPC